MKIKKKLNKLMGGLIDASERDELIVSNGLSSCFFEFCVYVFWEVVTCGDSMLGNNNFEEEEVLRAKLCDTEIGVGGR